MAGSGLIPTTSAGWFGVLASISFYAAVSCAAAMLPAPATEAEKRRRGWAVYGVTFFAIFAADMWMWSILGR